MHTEKPPSSTNSDQADSPVTKAEQTSPAPETQSQRTLEASAAGTQPPPLQRCPETQSQRDPQTSAVSYGEAPKGKGCSMFGISLSIGGCAAGMVAGRLFELQGTASLICVIVGCAIGKGFAMLFEQDD